MSAPVLIVGAVAMLALGLPVMSAASALETQQRAGAAADAAALAAADAASGWIEGEPCALAARVITEFRLEMATCETDADTGDARVVVRARTLFGSIEARSRAGPAGE